MRFLTGLLLLLLAACRGEVATESADDRSIIRLADADARGLDPHIISDLASVRIASDQFEGLTRFDARGEAEPGLAERWDISGDGLTWSFWLREGLRFSDGTPITANLFRKGIARIRDGKTASPHVALFSIIKNIEASDHRNVVIQLNQPFPQLPALLAHPAVAALPFHRIDAVGEAWTGDRPLVTSGPYRLTDWKLAQAITLDANPLWHGGAPSTPKVIWRPMENPQSGMRLMLAGGADVSSNFPMSRYGWLKENHSELLRVNNYLGSYYFAFNTRRPPFDNVLVRLALSGALDRQWMAEQMIEVGNEPAWGIVPPALRMIEENTRTTSFRPQWEEDTREEKLEHSRRLLKQAGYDDSNPLEFEIRFNSSPEHRRAAVAMSTMWREIGVDAKLLNSEASLHFDSLRRGDFDLARSGWIADLPAPENFLAIHRSDAGPQNYSGYSNSAFDAALEEALSERDPDARLKKMRQAEMILIADMPVLPLYFYVSRNLVQPDIRGWIDNISNVHPSRFLHKAVK